jgi:KDO2-lipid IV(A) lauroyltransferase
MSKLFLGSSLKKAADRVPGLEQILWGIEALLISLAMAISRVVPPDRASAAGRRLFRAIGPRLDKTHKLRLNLRLAFPEKSDAEIETLIKDNWGNIGAVLAEFPHLRSLPNASSPKRIEIVVLGESRVFCEQGKPAVFVAAHLSNWELPPLAGVMKGLQLSVVYSPFQNPWLDRMLYRMRERLGYTLVGRDGGMRVLIRELARGRSIGLIVDQRVDSGEPVPFFGMDMLTTVTPARLALRFDCELIPIRVQRLGGARFRVTFYPPVNRPENTADDQEKARAMTGEVNVLFEQWITEQPDEWLCTKRRWPKHAECA